MGGPGSGRKKGSGGSKLGSLSKNTRIAKKQIKKETGATGISKRSVKSIRKSTAMIKKNLTPKGTLK